MAHRLSQESIDKLIHEAILIEAEEAREAGTIGYMARALTMATIPHRDPKTNEFERENGHFTLRIMAPSKVGLPYGVYPRLLLSWISTEAVRTKSRHLELGDSLSSFMEGLAISPTGGRWGTIPRLKDQMQRLFTSTVSCTYDNVDEGQWSDVGFRIANEVHLWWDPKNPDQSSLWGSSIDLSESFYKEVVDRPVPIDLRAIRALKSSSMALDIYCWLTYRNSYLKKPTNIPWELLRMQFGTGYKDTKQGRYEFKRQFKNQLQKVLAIYPEAKVNVDGQHLLLLPGRPHVSRK